MIFSMAVGIVGLSYSIVITCLYFWKRKKEEKKLSTLLFEIQLISLLALGLIEIGCIMSIYYLETTKPVLNEIFCRLHILADIIWLLVAIVYVYATTNSKMKLISYRKGKRKTAIILIISTLICYATTCLFPATYHAAVNPNLLVIGGKALYPVYFLGGILSLAIGYMMWNYKSTMSKDLQLPIIVYVVMFVGIVAAEFIWFDFRINYIYLLYCFMLTGMYFTVESQDTKLLKKVEESREEAELANKAKTEFLSNISHEIRTPMNTILGFSQALLSEENLTEEVVKRDAASIKTASSNLLELINNILDVSRIESGKEEIDEKEYKIEDLLYEINSVISSKISKDILDFSINVDSNIPIKYRGDSNKLYKIIVNILENAIVHTKFGSVSLDVGGAYTGDKFKLNFVISNTGHEMTEAAFLKSFEDFAEEASTNNATDSVKLGLIVAKKLIKMMSGTIDFKNEKGKGTRYIISIDQTVIDDMKIGNIEIITSTSDPETKLDLNGKRVLVVDDNRVNIKLAVRLLEQFNLNIDTANNGKECIDLVKNNEYDMIFLDHMMPELDGIATLHILRDNGCKTRIIALTANSYTGSKDKYVSEGFDDYLGKPFKYKDLNKILEKYMKE